MVYRWRDGARWRARAQDVGERIEALRADRGGEIAPADVVEDARAVESPLHPCFEWNDAKAADAYRTAQARELIADVMVVYAEEVDGAPKEPVRAFANVPGASGAPTYTGTLDAMRNAQMRAAVIAQAKKELDGWRKRYRHYQELANAVQQVELALQQVAA